MYHTIVSIFLVGLFLFNPFTHTVNKQTILPILFMNDTEAYTENIVQSWRPIKQLELEKTLPIFHPSKTPIIHALKALKSPKKTSCKYCRKIISKKGIKHHETYRCKNRPNKIYYSCQYCDHKHSHPRDCEMHEKKCAKEKLILNTLSKIVKTYPVIKNIRNLSPSSNNCKYCNKCILANNNRKRHETYYCKNRPNKVYYRCQYCDRKHNHPQERKTHEKTCKSRQIS